MWPLLIALVLLGVPHVWIIIVGIVCVAVLVTLAATLGE